MSFRASFVTLTGREGSLSWPAVGHVSPPVRRHSKKVTYMCSDPERAAARELAPTRVRKR
jgi:hypothetical protein